MLTSEQLRAARTMLRVEQVDVVESVPGLTMPTLRRWEGASGPIRGAYGTVAELQSFYEQRGIIFIPGNGEGPGVRLKKTAV